MKAKKKDTSKCSLSLEYSIDFLYCSLKYLQINKIHLPIFAFFLPSASLLFSYLNELTSWKQWLSSKVCASSQAWSYLSLTSRPSWLKMVSYNIRKHSGCELWTGNEKKNCTKTAQPELTLTNVACGKAALMKAIFLHLGWRRKSAERVRHLKHTYGSEI